MTWDRVLWWVWLSVCLLLVAIDFFRPPKELASKRDREQSLSENGPR